MNCYCENCTQVPISSEFSLFYAKLQEPCALCLESSGFVSFHCIARRCNLCVTHSNNLKYSGINIYYTPVEEDCCDCCIAREKFFN